jgi:LuxR family transcriptional regulator, maltose regulon positive regulatory protein
VEQLLSTKLYIPSTRPELVPRRRLIERLDEGLRTGRKLTLISAPAGFGKTTLVTEWLDSARLEAKTENQFVNKIAWLSLDEGDNDLARFMNYFITALNRVEGVDAVGEEALSLLHALPPTTAEAVLTSLINEVTALPDRLMLVLDDYHLIEAQPVHDALAFLLENQPPGFHLVMATREDPHLPLSRLRARGHLTELRAADLRFTSSEAAEFLNQTMGLNLSPEDITALEARTEGWIAGLQLAAISLQGHADTSRRIQSFTGSHRFVLDYLVEEVLRQQPENIQKFLLYTSALDRLCGSLCDAVLLSDSASGQETLNYLEHANLLIIPLDNHRQWYRYHHLFADVLQARLMEQQPNQIAVLHQRASEWYEHNNLPSDAIRHALAAEDFERAASLAELAWPAMSGSFQSIAWLGWVKALPDEVVRARPVLSLSYVWAFLNAGQLEAAEARLRDVERWLEPVADMQVGPESTPTGMVIVDEEQFQSLPVLLTLARAYHAQAVGNVSGTVKYARRVLDLLPEEDTQWRGDINALLGLAYWTNGDLEAAHRAFSDGLERAGDLDVIIGTFVLADIKMTLGQLHEAVRTCEYGLQLAAKHGEPIGTEDVYSCISELHRQQGDLEASALDLAASRNLGEQVELPDWQYRWHIPQARLQVTQGDLSGALAQLDKAERLYVRTPLPVVRPITAMKARVWIRQGRLAEALSWAREQGLAADDDLSYLHEFEHITLARALITRYQSDRADGTIQAAMDLLARLLQAAEEGGRIGSVIEILVLQALAHEAQGSIPSALVPLERALTLAEPEGFVRLFVDEGPPMSGLLYEALSGGILPDFVQRLLSAFPTDEPQQAAAAQARPDQSGLIEPLSEREIEILQLISEGLTNQEIASRLYISPHTVKAHTRNINGKLGVNNRTSAVARAKTLRILHPD